LEEDAGRFTGVGGGCGIRMWETRCGYEWRGEDEFRRWISEMELEGEMTHGVRLILDAWRDVSGGWE
jgi:hypothetical protein